MPGILIFLLGTLGLVALYRNAFSNPHNHGFPRFFAFEAILGLAVTNGRYWFTEPLSPIQLISWTLLLLSLFPALYGFSTLKKYGKPDPQILDDQRQAFEKTTHLVTVGAYKYIRHPLYTSLGCLAWGVFFKDVTILTVCLVILASVMLYLTSLLEEAENLVTFGEEYAIYMQHTRRFIPFLF